MDRGDDEDKLLRSVALQNANSILLARQRAEQELIRAKEELELRTTELAKSLSLTRATLEATTDAILVSDDAGRITGFNDNYLRMWGIAREAMQTADHTRLLAINGSKLKDENEFNMRTAAIYRTSPAETFDLLELVDGRIIERNSRVQRVDKREMGRVWSFRDITERRRTEDALRDETRILELLDKVGTTLSSTLDLQALLQSVTDAAMQLSGARHGAFCLGSRDASPEQYLLHTSCAASRKVFEGLGAPGSTSLLGPILSGEGSLSSDDVTRDPRFAGVSGAGGMALGVCSFLGVPVVARSGEVIGGLFFAHPQPGVFSARTERLIAGVAAHAAVAIDNSRLYATARRDAAERTRLLEAERIARARAERMSEIKDEFLATLSHELRTPLNAILGWAQVLKAGNRERSDVEKGLDAIERNARVQTQLIEDLLDMSRITSGKVRLDVRPLLPVSIVEAALETVRPAADAKGIRIERLLDPSAGPISGDPNRLQQVVWNLVSNAIKFTPKGGKVQIALERSGSQIEIVVTDTGVGIKPAFLPYVFDRFRQADASTTRRYEGLGLGLAIVKNLVELHGGSVRVHSGGEGLGATFSVQLPVALPAAPTGFAPAQSQDLRQGDAGAPVPDLSDIRVLVVDDEADSLEIVGRVLSAYGARVLAARSAAEALELISSERPHVLLSDIGMPNIDGYAFLQQVRALGPAHGGALPAIALTAFARSEDRLRTANAGFVVHIAKPLEPGKLAATVASVVGRQG